MQMLVEHGANAGHFDNDGRGLLYLAWNTSRHRMYPWLVQNARDAHGYPLAYGRRQRKEHRANRKNNFANSYRHRVG